MSALPTFTIPAAHNSDCCCEACVDLERLEHPEWYAADAVEAFEPDYSDADHDRAADRADELNDILACERSELGELI